MVELHQLNEFSMFRLLWARLRGRKIILLPPAPLIPRFTQILDKLGKFLCAKGWALSIYECEPELRFHQDAAYFCLRSDIFMRTEDWTVAYFKLPVIDDVMPDYARPVRHICGNYIWRKYAAMQMLRHLAQCGRYADLTVVGVDQATLDLYREYYGEPAPWSSRTPFEPRRAISAVLTLGGICYAIIWLLRRLRLTLPAKQTYFLGADFVEDPRDLEICANLVEDGDRRQLVVLRNHGQKPAAERILKDIPYVVMDCGRFTPAQAFTEIRRIIRESLQFRRLLGDCSVGVYYGIAPLALRRSMWKGIFNLYSFDWFWCRDDYNVEHILRSQELRKIGGKSMGISHGLPVAMIVVPMWRYIDFDVYFTFGRHLYETYYKKAWPSTMKVRPVGSFGFTREMLKSTRSPDLKDIMILATTDHTNTLVVETVAKMASAFPDRRIIVKIKHRRPAVIRDIVEPLEGSAPNIIVTDGDFYEWLTVCGYVFGGTTTAVAEAIQIGAYGFAMDYYEPDRPFYYRDFPGLCVDSPDQAVDRIIAIENGSWKYRRENYGELIQLTKETIFDAMRDETGLPPIS